MLMVWNVSTGSKLTLSESEGAGSTVYSCRWSRDGKKLAASSGKEHLLRLYEFGAGGAASSPASQWLLGAMAFFAIALTGSALVLIIGGKNWWRRW
jgi:WD40 repeat protein